MSEELIKAEKENWDHGAETVYARIIGKKRVQKRGIFKRILLWILKKTGMALKWTGTSVLVVILLVMIVSVSLFVIVTSTFIGVEIYDFYSKLEEFGGSNTSYFLIFFLPICLSLIACWAYMRKYQEERLSYITKKIKSWWENGVIPIILLAIYNYYVIGYLIDKKWPGWWWKNTIASWTVIVIIGFILYAVTKKKEGEPFRYTLAKWTLGFTLLVVAVNLGAGIDFGSIVFPEISASDNAPAAFAKPDSTTTYQQYLAMDGPDKARVVAFWRNESGKSPAEAEEMIAIAGCESTFRQFVEGTQIPLPPKDDPKTAVDESKFNVMGVMQIHVDAWKDELGMEEPGSPYDPTTLEGNLKTALYIRNKYGATKWDCYSKIHAPSNLAGMFTVSAPVGDWSEIIAIPLGQTYHFEPSGPIDIMVDDDPSRVYISYPGAKFDMGLARFVRFRSRIKEVVNVTITRKD